MLRGFGFWLLVVEKGRCQGKFALHSLVTGGNNGILTPDKGFGSLSMASLWVAELPGTIDRYEASSVFLVLFLFIAVCGPRRNRRTGKRQLEMNNELERVRVLR